MFKAGLLCKDCPMLKQTVKTNTHCTVRPQHPHQLRSSRSLEMIYTIFFTYAFKPEGVYSSATEGVRPKKALLCSKAHLPGSMMALPPRHSLFTYTNHRYGERFKQIHIKGSKLISISDDKRISHSPCGQ